MRPKTVIPYLFVGPQLLLILIFVVRPLFEVARLSFHRWILSLGGNATYAGLQNYRELLQDELFRKALTNTAIYVLVSVPASILVGFLFALTLNQPLGRATVFFRSAFYVPVVVPSVVVALIWQFMLNARGGIVNAGLARVGLPEPDWFTNPHYAMLGVILASVWQQAGFMMVLYLAGLQGIPRVFHEAAAVDGANGLQRLIGITIPLLTPTTLFVCVVGVINGFKVFDQVYVMTGGGPANGTTTIVQYLFTQAFEFFDVGRGAAAAMVLLGILGLLTAVLMLIGGKEVEY